MSFCLFSKLSTCLVSFLENAVGLFGVFPVDPELLMVLLLTDSVMFPASSVQSSSSCSSSLLEALFFLLRWFSGDDVHYIVCFEYFIPFFIVSLGPRIGQTVLFFLFSCSLALCWKINSHE